MADKAVLHAELLAALTASLAAARAAHAAAIEGATHAEARAENSKDTRGLEQSYVARGQAQRVAELDAGVAAVATMVLGPCERVAIGALVTLDEDGETRRVLVAPYGGGTVLTGDVAVVTLASPFGRALHGKTIGDDVELRLPAGVRAVAIVAIA